MPTSLLSVNELVKTSSKLQESLCTVKFLSIGRALNDFKVSCHQRLNLILFQLMSSSVCLNNESIGTNYSENEVLPQLLNSLAQFS